jgi:hypothetical protein
MPRHRTKQDNPRVIHEIISGMKCTNKERRKTATKNNNRREIGE